MAEVFEQIPAHQLVAQRHEDPLLHLVAVDRQAIATRASRPSAKAGQAVAPIHHVSTAALRAFRQTGKDILRASCLVESLRIAARCHAPHVRLPGLHLAPDLVVHDSQFRNGGRHPLRRRVWSRNTFPGIGILDVSQPIPHESPDVQLVVEDSSAAGRIAVNGAGIPGSATWSRTALRVQSLRESLWRHASRIVAEDPANDFRFGRNDLAFARCDAVMRCGSHPVAVAKATSRLPELDAAAQSPACLVGKVFQEQRVHRALQADMQVRDVALSERDDVHAGEREALEQSCGVLLVSAESIQRLREHHVESLVQRVSHHRLEAGTKQRRARDRVIGEFLYDCPALAG